MKAPKNIMRIPIPVLLISFAFSFELLNAQPASVDPTIVSSQTRHIKGVRFTALNTSKGCFVLRGKDTIARYQDGNYFDMAFKDFNRDGYPDILIGEDENTPAVYVLLLYDSVRRTFREVKNFELFPDPKTIPGTKLYYSYHKNGCADEDWVSDLFYLDGFWYRNYQQFR